MPRTSPMLLVVALTACDIPFNESSSDQALFHRIAGDSTREGPPAEGCFALAVQLDRANRESATRSADSVVVRPGFDGDSTDYYNAAWTGANGRGHDGRITRVLTTGRSGAPASWINWEPSGLTHSVIRYDVVSRQAWVESGSGTVVCNTF